MAGRGGDTEQARTSRWARRFVVAGVVLLVCWQAAVLVGVERQTGVTLGLLGFVFHTVFGKAYSLVPSYFDRDLATTRLLGPHLVCSVAGTGTLAVGIEYAHDGLAAAGSILWVAGVAIFLGTLGWTVRDNLTGRETGTGDANAERQPVDRVANAVVPVALCYLAAGSVVLLSVYGPLPTLLDGYPPRAFHLLAAGAGALFVFAVGFRLLPRFFVASVPRPLVWAVMPTGAVGPLVIATTLPSGELLPLGALLEGVAVVGFAVAIAVLFVRSPRRRVGFYGVLAGALAGLAGVALGVVFALDGPTPELVAAHLRVNLLGFLGLTIVGVSYQFYPPAVGTFPGAGDRTALAAIALLTAGLLVELLGAVLPLSDGTLVVQAGTLLALAGAVVHAALLGGLFYERFSGRG